MANLFAKVKAAPTKTVAAKKKTKDEVAIAGLEQVAQLDALIKSLTAAKTTLEAQVKDTTFNHFFAEAQAFAKRPDNFRGVDGIASASLEMRKRSSASALTADEVKLLEANGLTVEKTVAVPELFAINPAYANDIKLQQKISKLLEGKVPDDIFIVQEEKFKYVVTDATMDVAFATKAPREVIAAITTMAIKPKLETTDISAIIDSVKGLLA